MPEVIGLTTCPICGADGQEVRVNKNGNLYVFCDHGCRVNFSGRDSRKITASLTAGKGINMAKMTIFPQKTVIFEEKTEQKQQCIGVIENGKPGRNPVVGRSDGKPAAIAGNTTAGRGGRGWLADLLGDDDDE